MWRRIWFIGACLILAAGLPAAGEGELLQGQGSPAPTAPQADSLAAAQTPAGPESTLPAFSKRLHARWYWYLEERETDSE